jgi:hypothetical protein
MNNVERIVLKQAKGIVEEFLMLSNVDVKPKEWNGLYKQYLKRLLKLYDYDNSFNIIDYQEIMYDHIMFELGKF